MVRFRCLLPLTLMITVSPLVASGYQMETVAEGLEHPWSLAWLPDGRMLVTERAGRLRVIEDGTLQPDPVSGVPRAHVRSQAGLFEVLPAPDFEDSGWLYLSLAEGDSTSNSLLVVRGKLDGETLTEVEQVFRAAPERSTSVHYGGRMLFLPDDTMLVTLGDGFDYREQAQDNSNHFGTIVRLHADGSVPENNPYANGDGVLGEIYSYGHRNVQGIARDPETGLLWANEHGPRGGDELNVIQPGANYGWPAATHGVDYSGATISPFRELPGMQPPEHVWASAIAPAGLAIYRGELFPDWQGSLLNAGLVSRSVQRITVDEEGRITGEESLFTELNARIRNVRVGPDGAIYLLTDDADGKVLRVTPRD
ncbi:MAG: PQQ-dependent sugar dehydrogenase [Ectothiorhodospiraceae bacterium]|nr:PQQ-dependent sugar dehydrogenase [Ectothiorhodospiraceae bacterium]